MRPTSEKTSIVRGRREVLALSAYAAVAMLAGCGGSTTERSREGSPGEGAPSASPTYGSLRKAALGPNADLNGVLPFPSDNAWNRSISEDAVDPKSSAYIDQVGADTRLFLNISPGVPYVVVSREQASVAVDFSGVGVEAGPYPIPPDAPREADTDRVIIVGRDDDRLYELYGATPQVNNTWKADAGAIFRTDSNDIRHGVAPGTASADSAGLPVFPGLIRFDEASRGTIAHALRFGLRHTRQAFVPPATNWGLPNNDTGALLPLGARVRLRSDFAIPKSFSTESRAVLQALKTYGMFLAERAADWSLCFAPDDRWDAGTLAKELGVVRASHLEVLALGTPVTP